MGNKKTFIFTLVTFFISSFTWGKVIAQPIVQEEVRLSKLTLSAFECSLLAGDNKEAHRLLEVGFTAGRSFLNGISNLTEVERARLSGQIDLLWQQVWDGTSQSVVAKPPPAALYGVVDFHKSCEEARGFRLPLSGLPIYYRRCANCKFLFTDAFDDWSTEQFKEHIYNDGYQTVDPDYQTARPRSNADVVARLWGAIKAQTRVLDYGGGNDAFCAVLRANGFPIAVTYDPMVPEYARRPDEKFELVTCFETLEHLPDPAGGIASILECAAETALIFFTTFAQPGEFENIGLNWWYVGPRNGHISIFSKQALSYAFGQHGYKVASFSDNIHIAFHTLPPFLAHLNK